MPQVILNIPAENIPLLLQITEAMGIEKTNVVIKDEIPDWHFQILNERLKKYNTSNSAATSWDEFQQELDSEDADTMVQLAL